MEKPDFTQIHKQKEFQWMIVYDFVAGCEHVWNTHVIPLQEQLNLEKESNILLHKAMTTAESRGVQKGREEMESENKLLREEIESLREQLLEEGERDGN